MMEALFQMMVRYQRQVGEIDRMATGYESSSTQPAT